MKTYTLHVVTGAPGAGKSTALDAFLHRRTAYLAFDIDWLLEPASALAGADIRFAPATWKAYTSLWLEMLRAVHANGATPVLFAPIDQQDVQSYGQPAWCRRIAWLLLDCDDEIRRQRLARRVGWTAERHDEAFRDAQLLRQSIHDTVDTGIVSPDGVAEQIERWLQRSQEAEADEGR